MKTQPNWKKENIPFTMLANSVAQDKTLSLKAKGLYYYLYSKPEDWQFSAYRIAKDLKCSDKTIRNLIKELEEHQLLKRQKQADGRTIYHITYPPGNFYLEEGKSQAVISTTRKKSLPAISTAITKERNLQKKEELQKKELANVPFAVSQESSACDTNKAIEKFKNINPSYDQLFKNTTQRKAVDRLLKKYQLEGLTKLIKACEWASHKKYAPIITTPIQLENKLGELKAFIQKEQTNKVNVLNV